MRATLQVLAAALEGWQRADCAAGMVPPLHCVCKCCRPGTPHAQGKGCTCACLGLCLTASGPTHACRPLSTHPLRSARQSAQR